MSSNLNFYFQVPQRRWDCQQRSLQGRREARGLPLPRRHRGHHGGPLRKDQSGRKERKRRGLERGRFRVHG